MRLGKCAVSGCLPEKRFKVPINRKIFFDITRRNLFSGVLTPPQVSGMDAILNEWDSRKYVDLRHLAYMFATPFLETNRTMQPVREAYYLGEPEPAEQYRKTHFRYYPYYGRGLVQLTWLDNYKKMGKVLGVDLEKYPDKALEKEISVQILFEGMMRADTGVGDFTGKSLEDYFNVTTDDPVEARRIINGTDRASEIAGFHNKFLGALVAANV